MTNFRDIRLTDIAQAIDMLTGQITALQQKLAALDGAGLAEDELTRQRNELNAQITQRTQLQMQLASEQTALQAAKPLDVDDLTYQLATVAFLGSVTVAGPLLTMLQQDPVVLAIGNAPFITPAIEQAILIVPKSTEQLAFSPLAYLDGVKTASGSDAAFSQLVTVTHHQWFALALEQRPYFYNDFGVLLPVRLETLFDYDEPNNQWTMNLRIIPDEASMRRDNPVITDFELQSVRNMWQAIYDNLDALHKAKTPAEWLDTLYGSSEWQFLCTRFSGARATWLVSTYLPDVTGGTVTVRGQASTDAPPPNRVGSFPDAIEVWVAFQEQPASRLATTTIKTDALTFDVFGKQHDDKQVVQHEKDRWWVSWDAALAVGLGVKQVLPNNHSPQDITTLYVVGIGEETPTAHFQTQIDAGEMALMKLGEPTNTVNGRAAANLAKDAETWRKVVKQRLRGETSYLSAALTGHDKSLTALPDANDGNTHSYSTDLVRALWPALWGHFIKDIWGQGENAHLVGIWASAESDSWTLPNLCPEGPLPPIRINDQPYGLLPTSSLRHWKVGPEEESEAQLETRMRGPLLELRRYWATMARNAGNVVGQDTKHLIDMIGRDALTDQYIYRTFLPSQYFEYFYEAIAQMPRETFFSWLEKQFTPAYKIMNGKPQRHYMTYGGYSTLDIPLVTPTHWPPSLYKRDETGNVVLDEQGQPVLAMSVADAFQEAIRRILNSKYRIGVLWEREFNLVLPDSLLIRLMIYAYFHSGADVVQADAHTLTPLLEQLVSPNTGSTVVRTTVENYDFSIPHKTSAGTMNTLLTDAFETVAILYQISPEQVERSLRATLDTASHRIDPWITGFSWRRLKHLGRTSTARFRMGVYGWLDGPIDIGMKPGPTNGGLLHTPSYPQALASVILRDKFLSEQAEGVAQNKWHMNIESSLIRMAEELAEETRIGSHIYEALGRRVERIIGTRDGVKTLRTTFPLRPTQLEPNVVCNGLDALHGLLATPPSPLVPTTEQHAALDLLQRTLATYSDLLLAEAVHQLVTGHGEVAGAAMDAAAGLGKPPTLEFVRTPAGGYSLNTSVITVLPFKAIDDITDASRSPGVIADASVAAFIETLLGTADHWQWNVDPDHALTLRDMQLEPIDTVMLSKEWLENCVLFKLGIEKTPDTILKGNGTQNHLVAREVVKILGSQPALFKDIGNQSDQNKDELAQLDTNILTELKHRYAQITIAATFMIADLTTAADEQARKQALFRALRWGITPTVTQDEQTVLLAALFNGTDPQDTTLLTRLTTQALASLQKRVDVASKPEALKQPHQFATAIAELAAPEGQLAILSKMNAQKLQSATGIITTASDATLDPDWLSVVAPVRPSLARLEALQLETTIVYGLASFATWSSAPQDHWQTNIIAANEQGRDAHGGGGLPPLTIPRFVAVYSVGNMWSPPDATSSVAVSLLDSWSEGVPVKQHVTTVAAGFNAPVARPPQAILLAVPPELRKPLDTQTLIDIPILDL